MADCVAKARAGGGPSLIEAITYRMGAHTTADDPTKYRPETEYQTWVERDPIARFRKFLLDRQLLSEAEVTQYNEAARADVQAAVEALEAIPPLDPTQLFDLVYAEPTAQLRRQKAAFLQEVTL
jgi:pyruvate dehydrogenase E1 component alpha subunit